MNNRSQNIWHYCPLCSQALTQQLQEETTYGYCPYCQETWYQTSHPAAVAIAIKGNQVLLTKRGIEPGKGLWDLPGGFLRFGEEPESGLVREVQEELGVKPTSIKLYTLKINPHYPMGKQFLKPLDIFYLITLPDNKQLIPADDVAEAKWFPLSNLPEFHSPHIREVVEQFV